MRILSLVLLVTAALSLSSCKKDENPASSNPSYTNKITFGTGVGNGSILAGEGTTFIRTNGNGRIFFRLESKEDFTATGVIVKIEKKTDTSYTMFKAVIVETPTVGHTMVQSFDVTDAGSYRATGLLYTTQALIATASCTVN